MYESYIGELIVSHKLPGAAYIVKHHNVIKAYSSAGMFLNNQGSKIAITTKTRFDLASLTKVICTLPAILWLHERKYLYIDNAVCKYIPSFSHKDITIRHLLQHTSGLDSDLTFKNRFEFRDVLTEILQCKIICPPNEKVVYSDLGMILLGEIIETVTNITLDQFARAELFEPWKMFETGFLPQMENLNQIAATEKVNGKYIHGEVHDEKAFQLGGVSGSAGLFSTVADVAKYAEYWLHPEKQSVLKPETMGLVKKHVIQNRGLGFEVLQNRDIVLACGSSWSLGTFGHTGFTGTSLWIDPKEEIIAVLLTNMVHYGREHQLSKIRNEFHTSIYKSLINS